MEEGDESIRQLFCFSGPPIKKIQLLKPDRLFVMLDGSVKNMTFLKVNGKWGLIPSPSDNLEIENLLFDAADKGWWGSRGRVLRRYDQNFQVTDSFSVRDGIPEDGNISCIQSDAEGNIWLNTHSKISRLDIHTKRILSLGENDGFQPQPFFPGKAILKTESGQLYALGGYQGLDRINPTEFRSALPLSVAYLKSISINQMPFQVKGGLNGTGDLDLLYNQSLIEFRTGIIDFYSKGESRIRYKLEGSKGDWQYGKSDATIRYEDLPSGSHRLLIQASNAAEEFTGPVKSLNITIHPPFWETWWFITAISLLLAGGLLEFIRFRSRQLRQRNRMLEEKVLQRTRELKHSLDDLRDTQQQLIQREKMASLGELTSGVAHEIQNPLNFVNNFSEVNRELIIELKEEMDKGNIPEVRAITEMLDQNTEKIHHHSRRADAIVKSMLQHSRIGSGKKESIDLNSLVNEYARLAKQGQLARDNTFEVNIVTRNDEGIGSIMLVPEEIGRVLLNLYNNAFYSIVTRAKSGEPGYEPIVTVTTRKLTESNPGQGRMEQVEIRVRDNGTGVPQKVRDKIFQPFFTTKPTGEGTGLGLSLSYDIITKMHGGDIRVESREGEYAEFIIRLPYSTAPRPETGTAAG